MARLLTTLVVLMAIATTAQAQLPQPLVEVSGGYGFGHNFSDPAQGHGWHITATQNQSPVFGITLQGTGSYGNFDTLIPGTPAVAPIPGVPGTPGTPPRVRLVCPSPQASPRACKPLFILGTPPTDPVPGVPGVPGTPPTVLSESTATHTFMGGGTYNYRQLTDVTPFARSLFGVVHNETGSHFGMLYGAGADFWTTPNLGVRATVDYLWSAQNSQQDEVRLSLGMSWRQ